MKSKLIGRPILQYLDYSNDFILTTDASNSDLRAVLSQGSVGKDLPVPFASRRLNNAENHYMTSQKELLALVSATKYFRPYLYGRRFKIVSDLNPFVWVKKRLRCSRSSVCDPRFAGSNPAEVVGFLRSTKSSTCLLSEGKYSRRSHVVDLRHIKDH